MVHSSYLIAQGKSLGWIEGLGPLGNGTRDWMQFCNDAGNSACLFAKFITTAIGIMTVIAIIWFIFTLFLGAIAWISSGGDKVKLQNAQKHITSALTGLIIVIAALFLVKLIGIIFGIDILNITALINGL